MSRTMRTLAVASGAVLFLGACMGGSGDDSGKKDAAAGYDASAAVTLTWWTGQTADAEKVAEKLAAEYHTAHPTC
jgi:multiple sugar transport system substrate-binding protein